VTKVSLLTNWLFLVVGGRGRDRRLQPLFWWSCSSTWTRGRPPPPQSTSSSSRAYTTTTPGERTCSGPRWGPGRAWRTSRRTLASTSCQRRCTPIDGINHNILVSYFALNQIKSYSLKFCCTNNPSDLDSTTQLGRCTCWPSTWAQRWTTWRWTGYRQSCRRWWPWAGGWCTWWTAAVTRGASVHATPRPPEAVPPPQLRTRYPRPWHVHHSRPRPRHDNHSRPLLPLRTCRGRVLSTPQVHVFSS
jgi:hypothetical protein